MKHYLYLNIEKMKNELMKLIRELSEVYDKNSKDTYVSVYLNKKNYKTYLQKRVNICKTLLDKDEKKNFIKTIADIHEFLDKNKYDNVAIFTSHKYNYFTSIPLSIKVKNSLIVDSSPYIRPLARILDEWESFTLMLLDSNHAKIFSVILGQTEEKKNISSDIMSKHKKGGWSQARFQRIRKDAIHKFFSEVAETLEKIADEQIVIAGPGPAKIHFIDILPKYLRQRILDVIDIDMDNEKKLLKESILLISEKEKTISHEVVKHLKNEILKDGLAVYGVDNTLEAVENGQIELLIVEKDYKLKGCICEYCQILNTVTKKKCSICGGPVSEVDVIEEIIELAERTKAEIEFVDGEDISNLGHIGGILRFK